MSEVDTSFDSGLMAAMWAKRGLCSDSAWAGRMPIHRHGIYTYIDIDILKKYIYSRALVCVCVCVHL